MSNSWSLSDKSYGSAPEQLTTAGTGGRPAILHLTILRALSETRTVGAAGLVDSIDRDSQRYSSAQVAPANTDVKDWVIVVKPGRQEPNIPAEKQNPIRKEATLIPRKTGNVRFDAFPNGLLFQIEL